MTLLYSVGPLLVLFAVGLALLSLVLRLVASVCLVRIPDSRQLHYLSNVHMNWIERYRWLVGMSLILGLTSVILWSVLLMVVLWAVYI